MTETYERMQELGMSQVDMLVELRKRGHEIQPPELSTTLRGVTTYPKSKRILDWCNDILDELERDDNQS